MLLYKDTFPYWPARWAMLNLSRMKKGLKLVVICLKFSLEVLTLVVVWGAGFHGTLIVSYYSRVGWTS